MLCYQNGILPRRGGEGGEGKWSVCLLRLEVNLTLFFFKKGALLGWSNQLYNESLVQPIISSVPELFLPCPIYSGCTFAGQWFNLWFLLSVQPQYRVGRESSGLKGLTSHQCYLALSMPVSFGAYFRRFIHDLKELQNIPRLSENPKILASFCRTILKKEQKPIRTWGWVMMARKKMDYNMDRLKKCAAYVVSCSAQISWSHELLTFHWRRENTKRHFSSKILRIYREKSN